MYLVLIKDYNSDNVYEVEFEVARLFQFKARNKDVFDHDITIQDEYKRKCKEMLKNEFYVDGNDLIIVVERRSGERVEYVTDVENLPKLEAVGKKFYECGQQLAFNEDGRHKFVKDFLMGFPSTRVSMLDSNPRNLRLPNLTSFGIRNTFEVLSDILIVYVKKKSGEVIPCLFDVSDKEHLDRLDCRLYVDSEGYVRANSKIGHVHVHRYLMEQYYDIKPDERVDHVHSCKVDNRKKHLRILSHSENILSQHSTSAKSGFPHVYKVGNKYYVRFHKYKHRNRSFDDWASAVRYAHIIRGFELGSLKGSIGTPEFLIETLRKGEPKAI